MKSAIMCIVDNQSKVETVMAKLKAARIANDDISVLFPDTTGTKDFAHEHHTKAPEGTVAGVTAGGFVGGTLGLLVGIGALAIPGFGPLLAAGPLLATLSGVAAGAAVGGIGGALIGMGIPEIEAKRYEGKIKGGNILISVHTDTREKRKEVTAIFESSKATDICHASEAVPPTVGPTARPLNL